MAVRLLIACLLGVLTFLVVGLFAGHTIALLAGILVGLLYFFTDGPRLVR